MDDNSWCAKHAEFGKHHHHLSDFYSIGMKEKETKRLSNREENKNVWFKTFFV